MRYSGDPNNIKSDDPDLMKILGVDKKEEMTPQKGAIATTQLHDENVANIFSGDLENSKAVIDWNLIKNYFLFGNSRLYLVTLLTVMILAQLFISGNDYWLGFWTNIEDQRQLIENANGLLSTQNAIYIYSTLITLCIVFSIVRNLMLSTLALKSSNRLHNSMFMNILDAKMSFFAENSSGNAYN